MIDRDVGSVLVTTSDGTRVSGRMDTVACVEHAACGFLANVFSARLPLVDLDLAGKDRLNGQIVVVVANKSVARGTVEGSDDR